MKKIIGSILLLCVWAFAALAQTPEEIVARMEAELSKYDVSEGVAMTVDIKLPIVGTMSTRCYTRGDKMRAEAKMSGVSVTTWSDGVTQWTYNSGTNKVEIEKAKESLASDGDMELFDGITDGYDVSLKKEDADAWYLQCKKNKANTDKDAPKTMDLAVRKSDSFPLSLSASMPGIKMTMRDISFGVSEKQVNFDINAYPGAEVVDKR